MLLVLVLETQVLGLGENVFERGLPRGGDLGLLVHEGVQEFGGRAVLALVAVETLLGLLLRGGSGLF